MICLFCSNIDESAKIVRGTISLLRCFMFFDLCWLVSGVALLVLGLSSPGALPASKADMQAMFIVTQRMQLPSLEIESPASVHTNYKWTFNI